MSDEHEQMGTEIGRAIGALLDAEADRLAGWILEAPHEAEDDEPPAEAA